MQQIPLTASLRQEAGKGFARRLRSQGQVPAVIYGKAGGNTRLSVQAFDLLKVLSQSSGSSALLSLSIGGENDPRLAVLQELQTDSLGKKIQHVDFLEVRPDQELTVDVTLEYEGEARGAAEGGIVSISLYTVPVRGKVADIPDSVSVDISALMIGDSIHVSQLQVPSTVSVEAEDDTLLVSCLRPALELEPEETGEEGEEAAAEDGGAEAASE